MDRASHHGSGTALKGLQRAVVLGVLSLAIVAAQFVGPNDATPSVYAQVDGPWTPPVNLSVSGSALQPWIALAPNGVTHALWWDTLDGSRYARGTISGTRTVWTNPQPVPFLVGKSERDQSTNKVTISPPSQARIVADGAGMVHATWFDSAKRLRYAQMPAKGRWSEGPRLSEGALANSLSVDISGTLQMAYVQSAQLAQSAPGVYYAQRTGGTLRRTLVYPSTYFRTANPDNINVGVAADGRGTVVVVWRQSPEDQSQFARSSDNGATWSQPEPIVAVSELFGIATQVSVAAAPDGAFLLVWRDSVAPGCGFTQRRSTDGGVTWSPSERILTELVRCPAKWTFSYGAEGQLWLTGLPSSASPLSDTDGVLMKWDGNSWSKPANIQVSYMDPSTQRPRVLGCLNVALSGANAVLIGCDARNDVWASQNQVALETILPTNEVLWSLPTTLSRSEDARSTSTETTQSVALTVDEQGKAYSLWARAGSAASPARNLDIAVYDGKRFLAPSTVLKVANIEVANPDVVASKMDAPSLVIDSKQRLHLVWSGGAAGRPFYSRALVADANLSTGWSQPVSLPALTTVGASPSIVADPRGSILYVIYTIPYNEQRGVYLVRTNNDGDTWSEPMLVADGAQQNWAVVDQPQLALDAQAEMLHAVWLQSTTSGSTGPRGIYYANSADGGKTWSAPLLVAQGAVDAPRIVVSGRNTVALIWLTARDQVNAVPTLDVWFQISQDGGARWTPASRAPGVEQVSGGSALVGDGAGQLYLAALSQGSGGQANLLFSQWDGRTWSKPDELNLGQPAAVGNTVIGSIAQGSTLHLTLRLYELKPNGSGAFETVAISRPVTQIQRAPLPTFTPLPQPTQTPVLASTATPTPQPEAVSTLPPSNTSGAGSLGSNMLLVSAGIATVVVVVGALASAAIHRRRR